MIDGGVGKWRITYPQLIRERVGDKMSIRNDRLLAIGRDL